MVKCKYQDLQDLAADAASMVSSPKKRKDAQKESGETSHLQPASTAALSSPLPDHNLMLASTSPSSAPLASSTTHHESSAPSSSSQQPPPEELKIDTQFKRPRVGNAQETNQPPSPPSSATMQEPRYHTRSASRRLPPPSPSQLRAGKYIVNRCDQIIKSREHVIVSSRNSRERRRRVFENTFLQQTTTSRAPPSVPPAAPNPSGVVPLGPPPPREPGQSVSPRIWAMQRRATFRHPTWLQPSGHKPFSFPGLTSGSGAAGVAAASFELLPPPSMSYIAAWDILNQFVDGLEDEFETAEAKDPLLKLQTDLGLPEWTGLFELFASSSGGRTQQTIDVMYYVLDYFDFWEAKLASVAEEGPSERRASSG